MLSASWPHGNSLRIPTTVDDQPALSLRNEEKNSHQGWMLREDPLFRSIFLFCDFPCCVVACIALCTLSPFAIVRSRKHYTVFQCNQKWTLNCRAEAEELIPSATISEKVQEPQY